MDDDDDDDDDAEAEEEARDASAGTAPRGIPAASHARADEYAGQQEPARARALVAPPARVPNTRARGRRGRRPRADGGVRQIRVSGRVPGARRVRVAARRLRRSRSDDGGVHNEEGSARATCADAASHAGGARISGDRMDNHSEEKAEESKNDECCF